MYALCCVVLCCVHKYTLDLLHRACRWSRGGGLDQRNKKKAWLAREIKSVLGGSVQTPERRGGGTINGLGQGTWERRSILFSSCLVP